MTTKKNPAAVRSRPPIPENLIALDAFAKAKGLSVVCVKKWIWSGKLAGYRVPGYGLKSFIVRAEAERLTKPAAMVPTIAR